MADAVSIEALESIKLNVDPRAAADQLFASSTLVDLLVLLCADPERRYYVNELIRRTGHFPRSVQLALAKLEAAGIVSSERRANVRFYQVVAGHPLFPELFSMCLKLSDVSFALRRILSGVSGIRVAFMRPEESGSSDIDLVVVGDEKARTALESALSAATARLARKVRAEFVATDEWLRQARRERSFVRWLLEEPRRYIIGGDGDLPTT